MKFKAGVVCLVLLMFGLTARATAQGGPTFKPLRLQAGEFQGKLAYGISAAIFVLLFDIDKVRHINRKGFSQTLNQPFLPHVASGFDAALDDGGIFLII